MTRGFILFDCISNEEVSEILKDFNGVNMVYTLSKGSYNTLSPFMVKFFQNTEIV